MKKTLGQKAAVIIPAILFACLHILNMQSFNLLDLILLILAGSSVSIMFTLFALNSDSIWPGALAHSLWNFLINCSSEITTSHQGKRIIDSAKRKADIFRFLNRVSVCCLL